MRSKLSHPRAVSALAAAYERLSGEPGSGTRLAKEIKAAGVLLHAELSVWAEAFDELNGNKELTEIFKLGGKQIARLTDCRTVRERLADEANPAAALAKGIRPGQVKLAESPSTPASQPVKVNFAPASSAPSAPTPQAPQNLLAQFNALRTAGKRAEAEAFFWKNRAALLAEEKEANAKTTRADLIGR